MLPLYCLAAPSVSGISGTIGQGQTLTISGSGFGTHADHNASRHYLAAGWENFETGVADSVFSGNSGPELVTNTALQKANSNYAAKGYRWATAHAYTNVWGAAKNTTTMYGFHLDLGETFQKKIFISGWFMFPEGFDTGIYYQDGDLDQSKFICMTPRGTLNPGDGGKTYFSTRGGASFVTENTNTEDGHLGEGDHTPLFTNSPMGTWHRFDIYADLTKPEGQKIHNWYVDGRKVIRNHEFYNADANLTSAGIVNGFNYLSWLMYQFAGDDTYVWPQYLDDAFANFTQARVEISESPTWNETVQTHKEIQIPTAWSDTSITVSANPGSIDTSGDLYLYVIDDTGLVNANGYLIDPCALVSATGGCADAGTPGPDASAPGPDAAAPGSDATVSTPDAESPRADATEMGVDARDPSLDAHTPGPDAESPGPDAAGSAPDAEAAAGDADRPDQDAALMVDASASLDATRGDAALESDAADASPRPMETIAVGCGCETQSGAIWPCAGLLLAAALLRKRGRRAAA